MEEGKTPTVGRDAPTIMRGIRCRLRPTAEQEAALAERGHGIRYVHNRLLGDMKRRYDGWLEGTTWECDTEAGKPAVDRIAMIGAASAIAAGHDFLHCLHSQAVQQVGLHLFSAYRNFFAGRASFPTFKRRSNGWSMSFPQVKRGHFTERGVRIPGIGHVAWTMRRELADIVGGSVTPKSMTVSFDGDRFHVSVLVETPFTRPAPPVGAPEAFDRGITETMAGSNGSSLKVRTATPKERRRLRRQARSISRKKKGSNRRNRAVAARRKTERRIRRRVRHDIHVFTTRTAKTTPIVVVERLNLSGMGRSAAGTVDEPGVGVRRKSGLNRELRASCLGLVVQQLAYKCLWHGGRLVEVPAAWSSQTCAACGHRERGNRNRKRFLCIRCGHADDADRNAACVLMQRHDAGMGTDITSVPVEGRKLGWRHRQARRSGDTITAGHGTCRSTADAASPITVTTGGDALAPGSSAL